MTGSEAMKTTLWHLAGIGLAAGVIFFVHLGTPALWDEDEPLYAAIALDMYQRGDLVVPRYNGQLFAEKPPLAYWLMMLGYDLLGINEWAVRLPSALFGLGTGWVVYFLGRRLFSPLVGFWGALATTTSLMFTVSARAATTDSVFVFFTTLGIYAFAAGGLVQPRIPSVSLKVSERSGRKKEKGSGGIANLPSEGGGSSRVSWWVWAGLYFCFSVAVLAKGPIGLVLPIGMLGLFLLIRRQWESADPWWGKRRPWLLRQFPRTVEGDVLRPTWQMKTLAAIGLSWLVGLVALLRTFRPKPLLQTAWQMRPITGLVICALVAAPWYLLVGWQTEGEFLWKFFWEQNVLRTLKPMQGHSGPIWYYIPAILVGFFPWSVFLGPALVELVRGMRASVPGSSEPLENQRRAGCVLVACWISVFVVAWSIPQTKLPHYVLTAYPALGLMTGWFVERWLARPETIGRLWMRLAIGSLVVVGIGLAIGFPVVAHLFTPGEEWLGVLGLILVAGAGVFVYFTRRGREAQALASFALMTIGFLVGIFGLAAVRIDRFQEARPMISQLHQNAGEEFQLAGYHFIRESFVFYAGRPIRYLEKPEELETFLHQSARPFVFSTNKQEAELREKFGDSLQLIARRPRFLRRGEILLWTLRDQPPASLATRPEPAPPR